MNELTFVDDRTMRDQAAGRVEVLDRVKKLLLLPKLETMTVSQIADYYEAPIETIKICYKRNKDEIDLDGVELKTPQAMEDFLRKLHNETSVQDNLISQRGKDGVTFNLGDNVVLKVNNRGVRLFSKRAILRFGMLLRDSKVAKEVRTQLLNVVEHTTDEQKTADIDEEQDLILQLGKAYVSGNFDELVNASMKYNAFTNRHIDELKDANHHLSGQVAEMQPKASYYDVVLNCKDLLATSVIAKDYGKSAQWLNNFLHDEGIQYKQGGVWLLYQKYADMGYTGSKTHTFSGNGMEHARVHTYWTQKGRLFIYDLMKSAGILPLMERESEVEVVSA